MNAVSILLRKEARQQAWALSAMAALLLGIGILRWLVSRLGDRAPSILDGAPVLIAVFVLVAGLVLGHRLVVREYQARTQLFLEALPLARSTFVAVKYAFGLLVLSGFVLATLGIFMLGSGEGTLRFFSIALLRSLGFTAACWSLFFAMGFLGRWRLPAYLSFGFGLYVLASLSDFDFLRFGPAALIDSTAFVYERSSFPWRAFAESVAVALGFTALGFAVALTREGSMAELLARRAPAREITVVAVLLVAELGAAAWIGGRRHQTPFAFTSSAVVRGPDGLVDVMYGFPELETRAIRVASSLARARGFLAKDLAVAKPPPLHVAHSSALDAGEFLSRGSRGDGESVLLEANLGAKSDPSELIQHCLHQSFTLLSKGRAAFEAQHWFLDGFSALAANELEQEDSRREWLRALVFARRFPLSLERVTAWERLMEQGGEAAASALGFTLVETLQRRRGRDAVQRLARATLLSPRAGGALSFLNLGQRSFSEQFRAITQEELPAFIAVWKLELERRSRQASAELAQVPADVASLALEAGRYGTRLHYAARGPKLERDRECVVLHGVLRPYDIYYPPDELDRHHFKWLAGEEQVRASVPKQYGAGERVFATLECDVPLLAERERLAVARLGDR